MVRVFAAIALAALALAAPASADISATFSGGTLTIATSNSGNLDETYAITEVGADIRVVTSDGLTTDPDALDDCSKPADGTITCKTVQVTAIALTAGAGKDEITDSRPDSSIDVLNGGAGDDKLTKTGAGATLLGDTENDRLTASGAGELSTLDIGGPGNDTYIGNDAIPESLFAETGEDTYDLGTGPGDGITYDVSEAVTVTLNGVTGDGRTGENDNVMASVEDVSGGDGADNLTGSDAANDLEGGEGADVIDGGAGDDELDGGDGADALNGGAGDDSVGGGLDADILKGDAGNDFLDDGDFTNPITDAPQLPASNDQLDGGTGDDDLSTDRGGDDIIGGGGRDEALFSRGIPQALSVTTEVKPAGFTVTLDDQANDGQTGTSEGDNVHSDVEIVRTFGGDDVLTGAPGANELLSGAGNDTVDGGAGADFISVGIGNDTVSAADTFTDTIYCGDGADSATVDLAGGQPERADITLECETVAGTPFPAVQLVTPPPDTTPPGATITVGKLKTKSFLKSGAVAVTVGCTESCTVAGELFTTQATVSKVGQLSIGSGSLPAGTGDRKITLKVAKKYLKRYRKKLKSKKAKRAGAKFVVGLTVTDGAGNIATASKTIKVKG